MVFGFGAVFPVVFMVMFALVLAVFVVTIVRALREKRQNDNAPRLTVEARVTGRRSETTHHHDQNTNVTHTSTDYYATFEVESGDRMEFRISGPEYGQLAEGDEGRLSFQGTRYLGFVRE